MRLGTITLLLLILFTSTACMKKSINGNNLQKINSIYNPQNPLAYRGEECPNGLTISVAPSDSTVTSVAPNTNVSLKVSASGCKYGYVVIPEAADQTELTIDTRCGGSDTLRCGTFDSSDPIVRMGLNYSATFNRNFSSSGAQSVRVYVFPKNSTGSHTAFFMGSTQITVQAQASSLNCSIDPANFYLLNNSASRDVILTVSSNASADKAPKLVSITGSGGYASVNRPFSNLALPATVVVNVPGSTSGTLQAKVQTNDSQTITCQASGSVQVIGVVWGNFVGRGASETIKDRLSLGETVGTNRYLKVDYAQTDGTFRNVVLSTPLALTDIPENLLAGDLDRDGKDDVLLYQNGSFRWMKSIGTDYSSYSFNAPVAISGTWPQNLRMANMVFVRGADANTPHKIKGTINGQPYFATIDTNSVSQPQPAPPSTTLSTSSTSVNSGQSFTVTWSASNVAGFSCGLQKKPASSGWSAVGATNLPGTGSEVASRTETQSITENTNYRVLCSKVEGGVTTYLGNQDVRTVTVSGSVGTQVVYRMADVFMNKSTGSNMNYLYTQNTSDGGVFFKDPVAEFFTYTASAGPNCNAQLYKCSFPIGNNTWRQFLSTDPHCNGQFPNGGVSNPSAGFVCTSPQPGTIALYRWYRAASQGSLYKTSASLVATFDPFSVALDFTKDPTPIAYVPANSTTNGSGNTSTTSLAIPGSSNDWVSTGIAVSAGKAFSVTAQGSINFGGGYNNIGPAGVASGSQYSYCKFSEAQNLLGGALIAKIGSNGTPFAVGTSYSVASSPASGNLYLGINDVFCPGDNVGSFQVTINASN